MAAGALPASPPWGRSDPPALSPRRQPWFYGWGFNLPRGQALLEKWNLIPEGVDVLITHGPPLGESAPRPPRVGAGRWAWGSRGSGPSSPEPGARAAPLAPCFLSWELDSLSCRRLAATREGRVRCSFYTRGRSERGGHRAGPGWTRVPGTECHGAILAGPSRAPLTRQTPGASPASLAPVGATPTSPLTPHFLPVRCTSKPRPAPSSSLRLRRASPSVSRTLPAASSPVPQARVSPCPVCIPEQQQRGLCVARFAPPARRDFLWLP